ncbi:DUF1893 domain-containing protein [Clostridium polynesiense]|uniref:DUF1893 domain-containing protein n=1 Tax=Clostridium polynesiense TaxID=1325933 RepID=UPI00058C26C5|nr:DUF1893 domain-containing protein [Clostridium polynesiense]
MISKELKNKLKKDNVVCAVLKEGKYYYSSERGIKPILTWINHGGKLLENASIADKVIGKAAALLLVYGGIKEAYTPILSEHALWVFKDYDIEVEYDTLVPYIINRDRTGICPMEQKVMDIRKDEEAFKVLSDFINKK